jgi:hypothetical protein
MYSKNVRGKLVEHVTAPICRFEFAGDFFKFTGDFPGTASSSKIWFSGCRFVISNILETAASAAFG